MNDIQHLQNPKLSIKVHPAMIICLSCLALLLVPALACNLPPRQPESLVFPTSQLLLTAQSQSTYVELPYPTVEGTPLPTLVVTPTSPPATSPPSESPYPFWGLQTATPGPIQPAFWLTPDPGVNLPPSTYLTQPGDTLPALAARFGVTSDQVSPPQPATSLLLPGQQLTIPNLLGHPAYPSALMPDSAIVYSPLAASFNQ